MGGGQAAAPPPEPCWVLRVQRLYAGTYRRLRVYLLRDGQLRKTDPDQRLEQPGMPARCSSAAMRPG